MNDQRREILQMLAEGKISADDADRLIAALSRVPAAPETPASPARRSYLRVLIDAEEAGTPSRINIRVPLKLLRAGVRLAALIPPQALAKANEKLMVSGVPFDLTQLKPDQLEALVEHLDEVSVDIDSPDAKVRIFCE